MHSTVAVRVLSSVSWLRQRIEPRGQGRAKQLLLVVLAVAAIGLHVRFATQVSLWGDEATYVQAGYFYAEDIRGGHPMDILTSKYNMVHPALTKLMYAGAILIDWGVRGYAPLKPSQWYAQDEDLSRFHESATFLRYRMDARILASICGILLILLLALYSPMASIFALLSTVVLTFTSVAYIEAPGMLLAALGVVMYLRYRGSNLSRGMLWAGVCIGLAAAAKYYFFLPALPIFADWLVIAGGPVRQRVATLARSAGAMFLAFGLGDPIFWTQNLPAFVIMFGRNGIDYSSGSAQAIASYHSHWYSNLTNLAIGFRGWYLPGHSPFLLSIDPLIALLAVLGVVVSRRRNFVVAIWLGTALLALAIFPAKFAQYTAVGVVPLCMAAALGADWLAAQYRTLLRMQRGQARPSGGGPLAAVHPYSIALLRLPQSLMLLVEARGRGVYETGRQLVAEIRLLPRGGRTEWVRVRDLLIGAGLAQPPD